MVFQVDVHAVPISADSEESISPSPTKMRKRARQFVAAQQISNSPDIQSVPIVSVKASVSF